MDLNSEDVEVIRYAYMREASGEGHGARAVFLYWAYAGRIPKVVKFLSCHINGECSPLSMNDLPTLFVAEEKLGEMCSYLSNVIDRRRDEEMDNETYEKCTRLHNGLVEFSGIRGSSWNDLYDKLMSAVPKIIGYGDDLLAGLNIDTNIKSSETDMFLDNRANLQTREGKYFLMGE